MVEVLQQALPGILRFTAVGDKVDELLMSIGADAIGHEDDPFLDAEGFLALEDNAIEEQVEVFVFQGALMEGADMRIECFGELTDERSADRVAEEGFNDLSDSTGGDPRPKKALERLVDGRLVGGEGLKYLLCDRFPSSSRDLQFFDDSQICCPGARIKPTRPSPA